MPIIVISIFLKAGKIKGFGRLIDKTINMTIEIRQNRNIH